MTQVRQHTYAGLGKDEVVLLVGGQDGDGPGEAGRVQDQRGGDRVAAGHLEDGAGGGEASGATAARAWQTQHRRQSQSYHQLGDRFRKSWDG